MWGHDFLKTLCIFFHKVRCSSTDILVRTDSLWRFETYNFECNIEYMQKQKNCLFKRQLLVLVFVSCAEDINVGCINNLWGSEGGPLRGFLRGMFEGSWGVCIRVHWGGPLKTHFPKVEMNEKKWASSNSTLLSTLLKNWIMNHLWIRQCVIFLLFF